jgi:hypothetical protein
MLFPI